MSTQFAKVLIQKCYEDLEDMPYVFRDHQNAAEGIIRDMGNNIVMLNDHPGLLYEMYYYAPIDVVPQILRETLFNYRENIAKHGEEN